MPLVREERMGKVAREDMFQESFMGAVIIAGSRVTRRQGAPNWEGDLRVSARDAVREDIPSGSAHLARVEIRAEEKDMVEIREDIWKEGGKLDGETRVERAHMAKIIGADRARGKEHMPWTSIWGMMEWYGYAI